MTTYDFREINTFGELVDMNDGRLVSGVFCTPARLLLYHYLRNEHVT